MQPGKCSKTQNACGARETAFAAIFISQLICWMLHCKEKQTSFPSSYCVLLQQREQEPLVCYSNTYRLRCPSVYATDRWIQASKMPGNLKLMSSVWFIPNCDICQQETGVCKHFREKWLPRCIPWTLPSIPTTFAPFSVGIRRMIMQNVVWFSL